MPWNEAGAQRALQESEERLNLATSAAEAGLWIMDTSTGHVWASQILRKLFGFLPDEELSLERFNEVIHPDDRERVRELVHQDMKTQAIFRAEYRIRKPDGSIRWIVARGRPYSSAQGYPLRLMGVSMDITERKQMELQLNWSQTLLDTLINSTSDMIWSVDSEHFGLTDLQPGSL